jgi:hypothetical protein
LAVLAPGTPTDEEIKKLTKFSSLSSHPGEDVLELYCLDRLSESEAAPVEEHLLVCEACQRRVTELDVFLRAARQATRELRSEERYAGAEAGWAWPFRPGWIAAGALAVLMLAVVPMARRPVETQEIALSALRGAAEAAGAGIARSGAPLRLNLDLTGIESAGCCILQLVSAAGKVLRETTGAPQQGRAILEHPSGLGKGQYWIRVKSNSGADLREFGLTVR